MKNYINLVYQIGEFYPWKYTNLHFDNAQSMVVLMFENMSFHSKLDSTHIQK